MYSGLQDLSYRPNYLPEEVRIIDHVIVIPINGLQLQELVAIVATLLEGQIPEEDRDLLQDDIKKFKVGPKRQNATLC